MTPKNGNPEASLDEVEETAPAEEFDLDLDAWLNGATLMTASVEIIQDAGLLGRFAAWERRYEAAKARYEDTHDADASLGDDSTLAKLREEGDALRSQLAKMTATWFVRALDTEERQAVIDAHPAPAEPPTFIDPVPRLVPSPTEAQANAYLKGMAAWETRRDAFIQANKKKLDEYQREAAKIGLDRISETISRAVVRVEVGGRVIAESTDSGPALTAETARSLIKRIGEAQVGKLNTAIELASNSEPEVPAAFLPESSETDEM